MKNSAVDRAIAAIAGRQHGAISREQLLALGLTDGLINYRVQTGRLHRLHRGIYAVGYLPVSPYARALAAVLACGPGAALSHGSAATLWGITKTWKAPLEVTARSARRRARLHIHRSRTLTAADITDHFGIPVTTPARTLLDNALRLTGPELTRAINDLRLGGYLKLGDVIELVNRHAPTRAANRLRQHTAHPQRGPTRSEFEDAFLPFAARYGLPEHQVNTYVAGHEADVFFPEHGLVVELDSWEFHSDRAQFERDRDRDPDLLAAGVATVRLTWERFSERSAREAERLKAILTARTSWR
ncbi:MAG TPA: type IV toxin-antitoxin system AbiEi family antitoxin domain-containing protein [Solirubrobacteraceae bacterium]|nr:type IV toxin-antitoxin system AbiEi family antitoxin domain-containing protein [Solirubrobacteraceae bacterium]